MAEEKKEHDDILAEHTTRLAEDKKSLQQHLEILGTLNKDLKAEKIFTKEKLEKELFRAFKKLDTNKED